MKNYIDRNRCAYHVILLTWLQRYFPIFILFILVSCTTVPKQTYINRTNLPATSKAAVIISVASPEVTHSLNNPLLNSPLFSWLAGYGFWNTGLLGALSDDVESSKKIEEHIDIKSIEESIANAFIQPLREMKCFQTIEYVSDKNQDNLKLLSAGYNMVIRLSLREMSIRSVTADHVKIQITMHGQMQDIASNKIVWDREEKVSSSEMELLENMKEKGPKNLNSTLEKAVKYLANDFIYLK